MAEKDTDVLHGWIKVLCLHTYLRRAAEDAHRGSNAAGPGHVLHYLARYTHRVAMSNHRLISMAADQVTFRWKDYAHGNKQRKMTIPTGEFLRRFFLHVLREVLYAFAASEFWPTGAVQNCCHYAESCWRHHLPEVISHQYCCYAIGDHLALSVVREPMVLIEKLTANQIRFRSAEGLAHVDTS
jgi:hypothetical protein